MTSKLLVLLQARVRMRWQHLSVGVDVDATAFALHQQLPQDRQVMAGDEDSWAFRGLLFHQSWLGSSEDRIVPGIQELHDFQIQCAECECLTKSSVERLLGGFGVASTAKEGTDAVELLVNLRPLPLSIGRNFVLLCRRMLIVHLKVLSMVEVGHHTFQAIDAHLQDAKDILVGHYLRTAQEPRRPGCDEKRLAVCRQHFRQTRRRWREWFPSLLAVRPTVVLEFLLHLLCKSSRLLQVGLEAGIVKVHICQRCEHRFQDKVATLSLKWVLRTKSSRELAEAQSIKDLQVLQSGCSR
mmetsp:Transcript_128539/g.181319  ORF Transcript_128539/g.181319 Transcript_128539/m.181319 type:complete len:297 (-) Transcript_128539:249-1139(-)